MNPGTGRVIDGQTGKGASRPQWRLGVLEKGLWTVIGFVRGILLGGIVAAGGLVAVSQLAGPVPERVAGQAPAGAIEPGATNGTAIPEASVVPPLVLADAPEAQGAVAASAPPVAPLVEAGAAPAAAAVDRPTLGLQGDAPATAAASPAEPPVPPPSSAPDADWPGPSTSAAADAPPAATDTPVPSAQTPAAPAAPKAEPAPTPAEPPPPAQTAAVDEALLQPSPAPAFTPDSASGAEVPAAESETQPEVPRAPVPDGGVMENSPPATAVAPPAIISEPPARVPAPVGTLAPTPGLVGQAPGVISGRLPRIDGAAPPATDEATEAQPLDTTDPADLPPLQRFARDFAGADGKPLFAILLLDTGLDTVNRQEMAALSLPLSIVIDPFSQGAADRAAIWRAGGQEVVMAATGIPAGAKASDLEQTFQALAQALPEAVAVIDPDGKSFQDNRPLAALVVPILAGQGRGLVTFDQGLNAADQVARREKLGAAVIFRRLDAEGEDTPVIRRYLDRAAFKAAQDGRVTVIGTLRPETVAAILEWVVEGKAATVTLAPVSALMAPPAP